MAENICVWFACVNVWRKMHEQSVSEFVAHLPTHLSFSLSLSNYLHLSQTISISRYLCLCFVCNTYSSYSSSCCFALKYLFALWSFPYIWHSFKQNSSARAYICKLRQYFFGTFLQQVFGAFFHHCFCNESETPTREHDLDISKEAFQELYLTWPFRWRQ